MTPAFIADLEGVWWVETTAGVVLDREWLRERFGPHPADHDGERQEMLMPNEPSGCRCNGTGAYTAEIPLADAVVLVHRLCINHVARRALVRERDGAKRLAQVMDIVKTTRGVRVYLRDPGGGKEWTSDPEALEPVEESA